MSLKLVPDKSAPAESLVGLSKTESLKDTTGSQTGYQRNPSHHAQTHPKKKSGFVITSVIDNSDGEESADEADEAHSSITHPRATDVDHHKEKSASEGTLSMTLQDGGPTYNIHSDVPVSSHHDSVNQVIDIRSTGQSKAHGNGAKTIVGSVSNTTTDFHQDMPSDSVSDGNIPVSKVVTPPLPKDVPFTEALTGNPSQPGPSSQVQQGSHIKIPLKSKLATASPVTNVSVSNTASAVSTTTSKPTSVTSTVPPKSGASRVYKVVKRETAQPVRRDSARWTCYDFGDTLTPNLGFLVQSVSDSRVAFHDHSHLHTTSQIPVSVSATAVPSSSSAYSLQHSESSSSVQRDGHLHGIPGAPNAAVQSSVSTSAINHDLDPRKLQKNMKPLTENVDAMSKSQQHQDDRPFGESSSDPEVLKNTTQSPGDAINDPDQDDDSSASPNVRIDNKIEAAMDLVKKHLMSAVRDEVDELKIRIVELQKENDQLWGILTPDQFAQLNSSIHRNSVKNVPFQKPSTTQSQPLYHTQNSMSASSMSATHDVIVTSQSQSMQGHVAAGHQQLPQKQSLPINQVGFTATPGQRAVTTSMPIVGKPLPSGSLGSKAANPQLTQPQQPLSSGQQTMQKQQSLPQQPTVAKQKSYQQPAQPVYQQGQQKTPQPQQVAAPHPIQAKRQQAYPQAAGQMQPGYQSQQVVKQQQSQPGVVAQQGHSGFQQQHQQQQKVSAVSQSIPASQTSNQYVQTSQGGNRPLTQISQSAPVMPRQHHTTSVVTSPITSLPSMHSHGAVPATIHAAHFQPLSIPSPSAAPPSNGVSHVDQKQVQS